MRIHNTDCSVISDNAYYFQNSWGHKPEGLWWAIDDSWKQWCNDSAKPYWIGKNDFSLSLDESNILIIENPEQLTEFTKKYATSSYSSLDWREVSFDYDGIEILYFYNLTPAERLRNLWVCSWDMPSGCLWNLSAINKATLWRK